MTSNPEEPACAPEPARASLARPYALTGGRTRSRGDELAFEALVLTTTVGRLAADAGTLGFEQRGIVTLAVTPIAVVELAARLRLPLGTARVLIGDLADEGAIEVHRPASDAAPRDLVLLERVLNGLRAL